MADLIDRQAAIDAVRDRMGKGETHIGDTFIECFEMILKALPSAQPYTEDEIQKMQDLEQAELDKAFELGKKDAQPEQQWIPCSERLPEEYGEYRITWITSASGKRLIGDAEFEVTSVWDNEHDRFEGEWLLDDYIKNYPDVKVLAWKPLEEPWRGES